MSSSNVMWLCGLAVAVIAVGVYFRTLHPSLAGGDSGELIVVAHQLGTAHPPGYPTFTMITKTAEVALLTLFPGMSVALAQNSFHAFLSAVALVCLYAGTTVLSGGDPAAGILAALLFGFAPNVWTYAVSTEVFPLNNLFMCLWLWLAALHGARVVEGKQSSRGLLYFSSFVAGFSLTNQHTSVLFVVPVVLWVMMTDPLLVREWRAFCISSFLFFLGVAPYAYLPWSSHYVLTSNSWGQCDTWDGFWTHFFRKEYGTFSLASKESDYRVANFSRAWQYYVGDIGEQTLRSLWILGLCALGFELFGAANRTQLWVRAFFSSPKAGTKSSSKHDAKGTSEKKGKSLSLHATTSGAPVFNARFVLFLVWLFYNNFFNYFSNLPIDQPLFYGVQQRFWLQPLIVVCAFIGVGFTLLCNKLNWPLFTRVAVALAIGVAQIAIHFDTQDESQNYYIRDYGYALLRPLPKRSILLTKGDLLINAARFVQVTENFRPDVTILDQELLTYEWYNNIVKKQFRDVVFPGAYYYPGRPGTYNMMMFLDKNRLPWKRRVFLASSFKEGDDSPHQKYTVRTFGLTQEVITHQEDGYLLKSVAAVSKSSKAAKTVHAQYVKELSDVIPLDHRYRLPPPNRYPETSWEAVILSDFRQALAAVAYQLLAIGELDDTVVGGTVVTAEQFNSTYYQALHHALRSFRFLLFTQLNATDLARPMPVHVRRNYGVVLQTLLKYTPNNASLVLEIRDQFQRHADELRAVLEAKSEAGRTRKNNGKAKGTITSENEPGISQQDLINIEEAAKHYERMLVSLTTRKENKP